MPADDRDRARGALYGLAIGDALGLPTQLLTRAEVVARWGPLLTGFESPPPGHPIADGMPAGSVTDDTEQAVLLGRLLVRGGGGIDPREWASALVDWERHMAARGSQDLLGPSTKRAVAALLAGAAPAEAGLGGTTNGAAMRITPVGIAYSANRASELLAHVRQASLVTHNTPVAMAGAAAVAAAVSAGVDGAQVPAAIEQAIRSARAAARLAAEEAADRAPGSPLGPDVAARIEWAVARARGTQVSAAIEQAIRSAGAAARLAAEEAADRAPGSPLGPDVAARIEWAVARARGTESAADFIVGQVGTSLETAESVPAAFAVLAVVPDDPWKACLLAASLGGDSDTIAAMAGAVAGACHGLAAFPAPAIAVIDAHGLDLPDLADSLLAIRHAQ